MSWRLISDYDTRGYDAGVRLVCPDCWPTHTEPEGRNRFGRTHVSVVRVTLRAEESCHYCDRSPRPDELQAGAEEGTGRC